MRARASRAFAREEEVELAEVRVDPRNGSGNGLDAALSRRAPNSELSHLKLASLPPQSDL